MAPRKPLDVRTLQWAAQQLSRRAVQLNQEGFACRVNDNKLMCFSSADELASQARELRELARTLAPVKKRKRA